MEITGGVIVHDAGIQKSIRIKPADRHFFANEHQSGSGKIRRFFRKNRHKTRFGRLVNIAPRMRAAERQRLLFAFRVKAQLRRAEYRQSAEQPHAITIGELTIDPDGCRASKNGKDLELTAKEFEILYDLAQNRGRVISRERLYERIWGEDSFGCDNTMMVHIRHLREKIEDNPATPKYIITMKGLGYKLVNPYER